MAWNSVDLAEAKVAAVGHPPRQADRPDSDSAEDASSTATSDHPVLSLRSHADAWRAASEEYHRVSGRWSELQPGHYVRVALGYSHREGADPQAMSIARRVLPRGDGGRRVYPQGGVCILLCRGQHPGSHAIHRAGSRGRAQTVRLTPNRLYDSNGRRGAWRLADSYIAEAVRPRRETLARQNDAGHDPRRGTRGLVWVPGRLFRYGRQHPRSERDAKTGGLLEFSVSTPVGASANICLRCLGSKARSMR